jgi:DNA-binding NarL/FixJ family response regulator
MNILIVDDHPEFLGGVSNSIKLKFPDAKTICVATAREAKDYFTSLIETEKISLALIDITLPEDRNSPASKDTGIELLRYVMNKQIPDLHLMVRSANSSPLATLISEINNYESGFVIADKGMDTPMFHRLLQMAIDGGTYTNSIRSKASEIEIHKVIEPKWLRALKYASYGLDEEAIAKEMNVTPRTIKNYWGKLRDKLAVDTYITRDEKDYTIITLILKAARKVNLISDDD